MLASLFFSLRDLPTDMAFTLSVKTMHAVRICTTKFTHGIAIRSESNCRIILQYSRKIVQNLFTLFLFLFYFLNYRSVNLINFT